MLEKYKSFPLALKASIWFVFANILQKGIQFISMPIYTRIMSTDEYGKYSLFLSWFNVICIFSSLGIHNGIFNKALVKYESEKYSYISSVLFLTSLSSLVVITILIGFHSLLMQNGFNMTSIVCMAVYIYFYPAYQFWMQERRYVYDYKIIVAITLLISITTLILGTASVLLTENEKSNALIISMVLVYSIISGFIFIMMVRRGRRIYQKEYWRWSLYMAIPLIPHYLSEILLGHADRIMIAYMCGNSEAGIYNIVYQISMAMTIIRTGISGAYTPWMFKNLKYGRYDSIKKISTLMIIFMAVMTLMFVLLGPEILKIAAPKSYYESVIDVPAIMVGSFFVFVHFIFVGVEIYYEKKTYVAIASAFTAVLNIILNYIFINIYGYLAAGYTTMVSYLTMSIIHFAFYKSILKNECGKISLIDERIVLIISIVVIFLSIAILPIYELAYIRWIIILLCFLVGFVKRKNVKAFLKELGVFR